MASGFLILAKNRIGQNRNSGMKQYYFGIDLGGTTIKIGLFSENGTLVKSQEIPTRIEEAGKKILPDISMALKEMMDAAGLYPCGLSAETSKSMEKDAAVSGTPGNAEEDMPITEASRCKEKKGIVSGVGLAVPGAVLNDTEVKPCVNLDGWGGKDIAGDLSEMIHVPVVVLNDANAAALGEQWQGGGRGHSNLVFVTLGTGIGGGIIINGKLITGANGAAGEIGHMKLYGTQSDFTEKCKCGKTGCAEQFSSATGLVRLAKIHNYEHIASEPATAKDIMDAAVSGNVFTAKVALEVFADHLGRMLANVSCVLDPDVIVIGGGVSKGGQALIERIVPAFRKYAFPPSEETPIVLADLGNDAGMYGAARYFMTT